MLLPCFAFALLCFSFTSGQTQEVPRSWCSLNLLQNGHPPTKSQAGRNCSQQLFAYIMRFASHYSVSWLPCPRPQTELAASQRHGSNLGRESEFTGIETQVKTASCQQDLTSTIDVVMLGRSLSTFGLRLFDSLPPRCPGVVTK